MANKELIKEAREALLTTDKVKAVDVAKRAIAAGIAPSEHHAGWLRGRHPRAR